MRLPFLPMISQSSSAREQNQTKIREKKTEFFWRPYYPWNLVLMNWQSFRRSETEERSIKRFHEILRPFTIRIFLFWNEHRTFPCQDEITTTVPCFTCNQPLYEPVLASCQLFESLRLSQTSLAVPSNPYISLVCSENKCLFPLYVSCLFAN